MYYKIVIRSKKLLIFGFTQFLWYFKRKLITYRQGYLMRLELVQALQNLIIAFIFYIVSITFAGWFESFIAKQVGDDSPENSGFLTLNPLEHFNVFGFAAVLWGIFYRDVLPFHLIPGWGRQIPLVPDILYGKHLRLRVLVEYLARSCAHFILLSSVGMIIMLMVGASSIQLESMTPYFLSLMAPFQKTLFNLFFFMYHQNALLFLIHFIVGLFKTLVYFYMPRLQEPTIPMFLLSIVILAFGLLLLHGPLAWFIYNFMFAVKTVLVFLGR